MRFAGRADSIGRTYQDDSERSSRREANEAETGWSQPAYELQTRPPAKVLAARISMSHLVPLLEFNQSSKLKVSVGDFCSAFQRLMHNRNSRAAFPRSNWDHARARMSYSG